MEIKQGDKVRVSKDAPRMFRCGFNHVYTAYISKVLEVDDGNAIIEMVMANMQCQERIIVPTKYLVKVDAEAKEAKFKVGDRVRFKNIYELQKAKDKSFRWMLVMFASKEATITAVENNGFYRVDIDPSIGGINDDMIECKVEPIATKYKVGDRVRNVKSDLCGIALKIEHGIVEVGIPYDKERHYWNTDIVELFEPTEQTEAEEDARIRQKEAELYEFRKAELDRVLHPEKYYTYEVTIDNVAMNWQRYEADLAKEVALKVANKFNNPKEAAEYAVSVAKAVVEGLKRK